jgi:YD repeat-containing protein
VLTGCGNGGQSSGATATAITASNDRGQLAGAYLDADGQFHAFDIDDRGRILGTYF